MRTLITTHRPVHPAEGHAVLIEDNRISAIGSSSDLRQLDFDTHHDFADGNLCPPFLDIHIHGGRGHDVMEATPNALTTVSGFLATRGVGAYFPTTVTAPIDDTLRSLTGLAKIIQAKQHPGATPLGIHLEGPFLSHQKRGVHPPEYLQKPSIELFDRFWQASEGSIRLMTIAPEIDGAEELIRHVVSLGVRVSLGHSNADAAAAKLGMAAGATSATHTFNAMRPLDHRSPGILGIVLDTDSLYAELICDGIHVDPAVVRIFWKTKGSSGRAILITDGISATGMTEGEFMLGGLRVQVKDGVCMHEGSLAGSVLTLDRAVQNFVDFTGALLSDVVKMVTTNPAALTGLPPETSTLAAGQPATFNILSDRGELLAAYSRGNRVR